MKIVYLFYRLRIFTWYLLNRILCGMGQIGVFKKQQNSFDPCQDFQSTASVTPPKIWLDLLHNYPDIEWIDFDGKDKSFPALYTEKSGNLKGTVPNESVVMRGLKHTNDTSTDPFARKLKISSSFSVPVQKSESILEAARDEACQTHPVKRIKDQNSECKDQISGFDQLELGPQQPRAGFYSDVEGNRSYDLSSGSDTVLPYRSGSANSSEMIQVENDSSFSTANINFTDVFNTPDMTRDLQANSSQPSGDIKPDFQIHHWQGEATFDNDHSKRKICQIARTVPPILPWESLLQDNPKKEESIYSSSPWPELISEGNNYTACIEEIDDDGIITRQVEEQRGYKWNVLRLY